MSMRRSATSRCPVDDTGRYSVRPSTTPRTIALGVVSVSFADASPARAPWRASTWRVAPAPLVIDAVAAPRSGAATTTQPSTTRTARRRHTGGNATGHLWPRRIPERDAARVDTAHPVLHG